jgi:hypothetical protein
VAEDFKSREAALEDVTQTLARGLEVCRKVIDGHRTILSQQSKPAKAETPGHG